MGWVNSLPLFIMCWYDRGYIHKETLFIFYLHQEPSVQYKHRIDLACLYSNKLVGCFKNIRLK